MTKRSTTADDGGTGRPDSNDLRSDGGGSVAGEPAAVADDPEDTESAVDGDDGPGATGADAGQTSSGPAGTELLRTRPTIKPVLAWIALSVAIGGGLLAWLLSTPDVIGDPQLAGTLGLVVGLVLALVLVRFVLRLYVLTRTQYVVTDRVVLREFTLIYRRHTRELPLAQLRGQDLDQSRLQTILGVGTVTVLTAGTNHSLGYVEFSHVPHPQRVYDTIRRQSERLDAPGT